MIAQDRPRGKPLCRPWTEEDDWELMRLWYRVSPSRAARLMGRSRATVLKSALRLGLVDAEEAEATEERLQQLLEAGLAALRPLKARYGELGIPREVLNRVLPAVVVARTCAARRRDAP